MTLEDVTEVAEDQLAALEARMKDVYCRVLMLESIASSDNILALGGHSIPIMRIVSLLRQELDIEVSARDIFLAPTIAQLARAISGRRPPAGSNGERVVRAAAELMKPAPVNAREPSPADFPLARLDQDQIDHWRALYPALEDLYPATGMQRGLIFHTMLAGDRSIYTNQLYMTFAGNFDPVAFKQAWSTVVARHAVLRTAIVGMDLEEPLQLVVRDVTLGWRDLDHRELGAVEEEHEFERCRRHDKERAFDFARPSLMRFTLIARSDSRHRFIWTYHHCLLDGWSEALVWDEVLNAYESLSRGAAPTLAPAKPFSDYIRWLKQQDSQASLDYWRGHLCGIAAASALTMEQHALKPDGRAAEVRCELSHEQTLHLRQTATFHQVTLFTLIQAAWAYVLHTYSAESPVVFGVTVSGRAVELPGVERMVGLFINTVPVKIAIDTAQPIGAWLRAIHEAQLEQAAHCHVSLPDIQRCAGLQSGAALFDTVVIYESYPGAEGSRSSSLEVLDRHNDERTHYGLTLLVVPADRLTWSVGFDASRFDRADVQTLADKLTRVLHKLAAASIEQPVRTLCAPATNFRSEKQSMMSIAPERSEACRQGELRLGRYLVHQLIENHAASTPQRLALICNDKAYSYDELNRAANRRANHLLQRFPALKADDVVGVMLPRGDALVLAILAIWKAGAAYVPIDPELPRARVQLMLQNANVSVLVCDRSGCDRHPYHEWNVTAVVFDDLAESSNGADADPNVNVSGNDLSYVIYTSGSTGVPKGAMVEHIGMLNNIANKVIDLEISADSRVAQNASASFDISVWQMFIALTQGAATVIYDDRLVNDIDRFVTRLMIDRITVVEMVPSYLILVIEQLAQRPRLAAQSSLRFLVLTGESADAAYIREWFKYFPATRVMNAYGPTEASDDITHHVIHAGEEVSNPVPIGRVLANFDIYIVDEQLNPLPIGEKGEIVVTGVGVGRGYLNLAGATSKAFVASPFPDRYRGRLYRTGDVGQMRADGSLLFHGRKDKQVKVHGFRIELEEVELKILELPWVKQVAVLDFKPDERDAFLCAFVVPHGAGDKEALVRELEKQLPAYMVPGEVRFIERLPQLDNGKIDRKELRNQYGSASVTAAPYEAPSTQAEIRLAQIWQQVLRLEKVGVLDDFFALGGDSFRAIRIAAKYGAALEVTDIYELRNIRALAQRLEQSSTSARRIVRICGTSSNARVAVLAIPNSGGDPVSFLEMGRELQALGEEIELHAVKLPRNSVDGSGMMAEIDRLTAEIGELIRTELTAPLVVFGQCNGSALAISITRWLLRAGAPVRALCIGGALFRTRETGPDMRGDRDIIGFLRSIDASLPEQHDELAFFLSDFRYDSELADAYYNELVACMKAGTLQPLGVPIYCLVGGDDLVVKGYAQRYADWRRLSGQVELIEFAGKGHFLLRDCPGDLALAIRDICLRGWRGEDAELK